MKCRETGTGNVVLSRRSRRINLRALENESVRYLEDGFQEALPVKKKLLKLKTSLAPGSLPGMIAPIFLEEEPPEWADKSGSFLTLESKAYQVEFAEKSDYDAGHSSDQTPVFDFDIQEFMTRRRQDKFFSRVQVPHSPREHTRIKPSSNQPAKNRPQGDCNVLGPRA